MKLDRIEIESLYGTLSACSDVIRDEYGHLVSFSYIKEWHDGKKKRKRKIKVSLKSLREISKRNKPKILSSDEFYKTLFENADNVTDVHDKDGKIYKYSLGVKKFETDKPDVKGLFEMFPYSEFLKITKYRFWHNDQMLRNGYFSGLIGANDFNIQKYLNHREEYDLYDVDFNAAYPYCTHLPLPYGKFYTVEEWNNVKHKYKSYIRFFKITVKKIKNSFDVWIPPAPFIEYMDFDFLLPRTYGNMIVSEYRLSLIMQIYGDDAVQVQKEYFCATKIYIKLQKFCDELFEKIQAAKLDGNFTLALQLKIALNSIIGQFGRRDETRKIIGVTTLDNGIYNDVIQLKYSPVEYKEQPNYLPLAMVVNDITARRLFNMMTDKNVLRLCYNTDGGIIAIKRGQTIRTAKRIGRLKIKKIIDPVFLHTEFLYNRPLVFDKFDNSIYNYKAMLYDEDQRKFIAYEQRKLNTGHGFITHLTHFSVPTEPYKSFNLRASEIVTKLANNDKHRNLLLYREGDGDEVELKYKTKLSQEFYDLTHPYSIEKIKTIRHAPKFFEWHDTNLYYENFFNVK